MRKCRLPNACEGVLVRMTTGTGLPCLSDDRSNVSVDTLALSGEPYLAAMSTVQQPQALHTPSHQHNVHARDP